MTILIIAEHDGVAISSATLSAVTAALSIGSELDMLIVGFDLQQVVKGAAKIAGVSRVMVADSETYVHQLPENVASLVVQLSKSYSHILAAATSTGKNVLPRVAALLDVDQISDVISVESATTFKRPIYAGNAIATVESSADITVLTVRTASFAQAPNDGGSAQIDQVSCASVLPKSRFVSATVAKSERPDLTSAKIVISGGRGMKNGENFQYLYDLADKLGGAVGASRAAVDSGFAPNELQVGQTGRVVAPQLYVAVGISGAIQHLAGMKDSKVIVAINIDEEAPIFQVADYGLVGDLFTVVPEVIAML